MRRADTDCFFDAMKNFTAEQKIRARTLGIKLLGILALGIAYFIFTKLTGLGIPCVFHLVSGKYCPGCGVSRMCIALFSLDFSAAFRANAFVMSLLPFGAVIAIRQGIIYIKQGKTKLSRLENILIIIAFVLCVVFTVLRNTESFAFLAPI